MNPHLPLVESMRSLSCWRFSGRDYQFLCRERYRSFQLNACLIGDVFDFGADGIDVLGVRAGQANSSFGNQPKIPSLSTFVAKSQSGSSAVKTLV